jgi:hypothetical protein
LHSIISSSINRALYRKKSSKYGYSYLEYLPTNYIEDLYKHLEKQFEEWMFWDNWTIYDPTTWNDNDKSTWTWQIDHIIPRSDLPYSSMEDDNFKKCWALENLRPYSAKQNILDGVNKTRHRY